MPAAGPGQRFLNWGEHPWRRVWSVCRTCGKEMPSQTYKHARNMPATEAYCCFRLTGGDLDKFTCTLLKRNQNIWGNIKAIKADPQHQQNGGLCTLILFKRVKVVFCLDLFQ